MPETAYGLYRLERAQSRTAGVLFTPSGSESRGISNTAEGGLFQPGRTNSIVAKCASCSMVQVAIDGVAVKATVMTCAGSTPGSTNIEYVPP